MRTHILFRYVGFILLLNSVFLLISSIISALSSDTAFFPLLYSAIIAILFGVFPLVFVPPKEDITNSEGLLIVVCSWLVSCLIGMLPYLLWGGEFTLTNAWFESVSGYTTSGSSILVNIEALPPGLLFWRAATHWLGGIGIIIFVLSVLPNMGVAGIVLYRSEVSFLAVQDFRHGARKAVQILLSVYVGLTVLESVALMVLGMNVLDSVTHSFATIATGGFSTKNASIAYFQNGRIETVIVVFMILSGIHFALLFSAITGRVKELWKSAVVRYYLLILLVGIVVTAVNVHGRHYHSWAEALRYSAFQVVSIGTSTGFATTDTSVWPPLTQVLLIFFTLQCACAGSTSGGIKMDRILVFVKVFQKQLKQIRHPTAVIPVRLGGGNVSDDVIDMSVTYIAVYLAVVLVSTMLLTALGMDVLSAFSGSAATMGNVGPGLGTVGSMSNFAGVPALGKWVLTATMLLGRLEIYGLIMFFMPNMWKR